MNLESMKAFLLVVEERSISKGATRAHVSQSALSQTIHKLEEDLGYPLLLRSNCGVNLTTAGEIVVRNAGIIIHQYERMLEELYHTQHAQHTVHISGTYSLAAYSLPCMIYLIKKAFPEYQFGLDAKNAEDIIRDVLDGVTDIGFVDTVVEDPDNLQYYRMGKERVVLIAKEGFPVSDSVHVQDLFGIEMIMCTMNRKTCDHLDRILQVEGRKLDDLNIIFYADSLAAVKSSVLNGFGMAFVPYESVKRELYDKLVKLVTVDEINLDYDIYMVTRKMKKTSPVAVRVREYLIREGVRSFC